MRADQCLNNHQVYCHRDSSLILFDLFEFEQNVRNTAGRYIQNSQSGDKTKGDFSLFDSF